MNVRKMKVGDIEKCAEILCAVYNNELWMCRWDKKTAVEYLTDFLSIENLLDILQKKMVYY